MCCSGLTLTMPVLCRTLNDTLGFLSTRRYIPVLLIMIPRVSKDYPSRPPS